MTRETRQKETNVAIYARVSTIGKGQDIDLQLRDLRAYATSRGLKNMLMTGYRAGKTNALPSTPL